MQSDVRRRGRHRKPPGFIKSITPYVLIALCLGAILTIGWTAVSWLLTPTAIGTVAVPPQESFVQQYPDLSPVTNPDDKNCGDFPNQKEVQKYFIEQGGPTADPDNLDLDNNGLACENYEYSTLVPSTPSRETEPNDQQS